MKSKKILNFFKGKHLSSFITLRNKIVIKLKIEIKKTIDN